MSMPLNEFLSNDKSRLPFAYGALITLLDMSEIIASNMVHITGAIEHLEKAAIYHINERGQDWEKERELRRKSLEMIIPMLDDLFLNCTKDACLELVNDIEKFDPPTLKSRANEIRSRLASDLRAQTFYQVKTSRRVYFGNPSLADVKFKNWPKANGELIEAGNCFALDRYTACVCHAMRAVEYVLRSLEDALKVTRKPLDTWAPILEAIGEKGGAKGRNYPGLPSHPPANPSPEWQSNPEFFQSCYEYIQTVAKSCRDSTFHVRSSYDEINAKEVLDATIAFCRRSAEGLNEV